MSNMRNPYKYRTGYFQIEFSRKFLNEKSFLFLVKILTKKVYLSTFPRNMIVVRKDQRCKNYDVTAVML